MAGPWDDLERRYCGTLRRSARTHDLLGSFGRWTTSSFLDRVAASDPLSPAPNMPDLRGYVELMMRSGFPEPALRLSGEARERWLESYVEQLLTRDAEQVDGGRDPARLRRYFEAYAVNTAGAVDDKSLCDAAGINRKPAVAYEGLLTNLLVVDAVPAWTSNRLKRLNAVAKALRHRPALVAALLGVALRSFHRIRRGP